MDTIPVGLCQCGCGQRTNVPAKTDRRAGQTKGVPIRFVSGHNVSRQGSKKVRDGKQVCCRCRLLKPVSDFGKQTTAAGLRAYCKPCELNRQRIRFYSISTADYERLAAAQNSLCAICGQPETRVVRGRSLPLAIDHNHRTEKVRALLCHKCNQGLGSFDDSPERLRAAALYLERHD